MVYKIYYINKNVEKDFDKSINKLKSSTQSKILRNLELLRNNGPRLAMPQSKTLTKNLFELRINGGEKIRILYTFNKEVVYLLTIFKKKTQKTPLKVLNKAKKLLTSI